MDDTTKTAPEERANEPQYWAVIPSPVRYDENLTPSEKLLYGEISSLTNKTGYCFAANAYFAELYGLTERTIRRMLADLQEYGYIRIEDGNGGRLRRRIYAGINPLSPAAPNPDKNVREPGQKCPGNPDKNVRRNNKYINQENNPPKAPQGAGADIWDKAAWDRFWAIYPRKVDKAKAIRAWNKLKADRKLMQIMSAALKAQRASEEWRRDNGRAIPYPSTWLNNRRWEDELEDFTPAAPARAPAEEAIEWEN